LQEGQIMIEGWLDVSYAVDYLARFSPSASNIWHNNADTNANGCDFPRAYKIDPRRESHLP